jgi:type I restriction enzyme R subunit
LAGGDRSTNFAHLQVHDEQLVRLGMLAEKYFADDPNTALLKVRQFCELLAQMVAAAVGQYASQAEAQYDLLRRLQDHGIVPPEIGRLFSEARRVGNSASHALRNDHASSLSAIKIAWQLSVWFHRTFKQPDFKSGPFVPPPGPGAGSEAEAVTSELARLQQELDAYRATHHETAERLVLTERLLQSATDERAFWEQLAAETESRKVELATRLAQAQAEHSAQSRQVDTALIGAATSAAKGVHLDEAETRLLIDMQLCDAGWIADTSKLSYPHGARPERGKNLAIAEWPTASGPADYVLFVGLTPVAAIEAKRKNLDVSSALQQAKRYSRSFRVSDDLAPPGGPWGDYQLPLVFSSNGRPYLRQLATKSLLAELSWLRGRAAA